MYHIIYSLHSIHTVFVYRHEWNESSGGTVLVVRLSERKRDRGRHSQMRGVEGTTNYWYLLVCELEVP